MPKPDNKNSLVFKIPDQESLLEFKTKLQNLIGQRVPSAYSATLCAYLSKDFFDKTAQERFHELCGLRFESKFEKLLQDSEELSYLFLIKSVDNLSDLIAGFKKNRLGQNFIIPMELEAYNQKINHWLGIQVTSLFSSGLYYYLSSDFFDKSPQTRFDELYALRLRSDFMSYLERDKASYLFLKKSVDNQPELLAQLKTNRLGRNYLIPMELKLFNQALSKFVGEALNRDLTDPIFPHLSSDFLNKGPEARLAELCLIRTSPDFLKSLGSNKEFADLFLRKSLNDSPELLAQLELNRLGQHYLISNELKRFKHELIQFMSEHTSEALSNALFRHLTADFFHKSPEDRFKELCILSKRQEFLNALIKDKPTANTFLRKALNHSLELLTGLQSTALGEHCLLPSRKVRKRRLECGSETYLGTKKDRFFSNQGPDELNKADTGNLVKAP